MPGESQTRATAVFRFPVALNDDLRELLEAMTRHLASAMEGLRATALEREAAVAQERSMIARELHDELAQAPFELRTPPLLRVILVRLAEDEHRLLFTCGVVLSIFTQVSVVAGVGNFFSNFRALSNVPTTSNSLYFLCIMHLMIFSSMWKWD